MSSKNTINILLSLFVVTLLTNCTTLERPKPTGHLIKDQTFVQQKNTVKSDFTVQRLLRHSKIIGHF